jgi:hypothetical protein
MTSPQLALFLNVCLGWQVGRVPLGQQISYFEKTRAQIVETMGEKAAAEFLEKAMFTVAAGSNDILEFLSPSVPFFGGQKPDPAVFQDALVSKLAFYLKVVPLIS